MSNSSDYLECLSSAIPPSFLRVYLVRSGPPRVISLFKILTMLYNIIYSWSVYSIIFTIIRDLYKVCIPEGRDFGAILELCPLSTFLIML